MKKNIVFYDLDIEKKEHLRYLPKAVQIEIGIEKVKVVSNNPFIG